MTPAPTHRSCGHLASGPEGFPCPHPKCWASGALAVVSLVDGSEELYERALFNPASSAAFFGWRKVGESVALAVPSMEGSAFEPIPAFGTGAMAAAERNAQRLEAVHMAQGAEMAKTITDHLRSEAADSNREHLKAHQDVQRAAKKGKKP